MSKKLTREEVANEMKLCMQEIEQLQEKVRNEDNFKTKMTYIEQMVELANRMSELDTINKKLIIKEIKKARKQTIKQLLKLAKQQIKVELS